MHVEFCSNFLCVSLFSSVNSECSDEGSHCSDNSDLCSAHDSEEEDDNSDEESDLEGMAPTTKRSKVARGKALSFPENGRVSYLCWSAWSYSAG